MNSNSIAGAPLAVAQTVCAGDGLKESIAEHASLMSDAADAGACFVLFPELSLTGYSRSLTAADAVYPDDPVLAPVREIARRRNIAAMLGAPVSTRAGLTISSLCVQPDGSIDVYSKQHLYTGEEQAFVPGTGGELMRVSGYDIAPAICFETSQPSHVQSAADRGATVYAASCFFSPDGYSDNFQRLQGHASKHSLAVLMSNYGVSSGGFDSAGGSAAWSAHGKVIATAAPQGPSLLIAERSALFPSS